jgi:alkylation response protein AidB-like acyl-CoA dehydrogenase
MTGWRWTFRRGLEVIAALSRLDGSLGWIAWVGSGPALFLPLFPRATYDQIYRYGPDVILAGSAQPAGTAEQIAGGWRVNGRWGFMSGCEHADWIGAFCIMTENGKPLTGPAGAAAPPPIGVFLLPARDWQIEDTWYVAGLKGTGSHHVALRDAFVPASNFISLSAATPCMPGPLYSGFQQMLPLLHGANSVGMAEGALDALVALAQSGRQQLRAAVPMRESEVFQYELGRAEADIKAARALLATEAASLWRHALAGTLNDEALTVRATQAAVWTTATCVRAADACFALGGGSAIYDSSPLQRWLRDLHAAAQHALVQERQYTSAGKLLLTTPGGSIPG